jgi:GNAT superfamily N-acetyltransferase
MSIDRIPIVLVARDDAGPMVGTASLLFDDLEGDPRNPWLASVFVPAEQRGKGIASALVVAIEDAARRLRLSDALSFHDLGRPALCPPGLACP